MRKAIGVWLLLCSACVWVVLVTGGVTRLTHSGLSIVEWKPVVGVVPPLGAARWEAEFEKYRATPEYLKVNAGMSLAAFKSIYLMEYSHRLLARGAGLVFLVPFLYFGLKRALDRPLALKLSGVALLWALQGALGWYMVASGLVHEPRVSHYRLTAHLLAACLLYAAMLSIALGELRPADSDAAPRRPWFSALSAILVGLAFLTIASGGLVAGLRAGLAFNTFPLIGNYWVPPYLLELRPLWSNFFENKLTVQYDHRVLAALLALTALASWLGGLRARLPRRAMTALHLLAAVTAAQVALGAFALLYRVPVVLGTARRTPRARPAPPSRRRAGAAPSSR
ncbi:MAG: COX15/CtaA family protein, partial [Elusimicrobia bacterium]|nr:COX15/CtaA family protein [Elusimicrobiota bacterium]